MNERQAVLLSDLVIHNEIPVENKVTFFFVEFIYEYLLLFLMATFSNFLFIMLCSNGLLSTLYGRIVSYCIHFFEPSINFMSILILLSLIVNPSFIRSRVWQLSSLKCHNKIFTGFFYLLDSFLSFLASISSSKFFSIAGQEFFIFYF